MTELPEGRARVRPGFRHGHAHRSLGQLLADRANSLTFVRVVLAGSVIVGHSASLSGLAEHPLVGGVGVGSWGVFGFFAISGYVVTQSRQRLRLHEFLANRALRILPAFWVVNILTAIVAAPLAAWLASSPLDPRSAGLYVVRNAGLVMNQWEISGTLGTAPFTSAWNGSLWTLAQEAGWYLVVALLFLSTRARSNQVAVSFLGLLLLTALNVVAPGFSILGAFFVAGVLAHSLSDRITIRPAYLVVATVVLVLAALSHTVVLVAPLPLAYLVLSAAALPVPPALVRTDVSYGLYIYAFPVQQLLAVSGAQRAGLAVFTVSSFLVTLPLAWLSWRLVEAPALRLRPSARRHAAPGAGSGHEVRVVGGNG